MNRRDAADAVENVHDAGAPARGSKFTWAALRGSLADTLPTTGMIYVVITGAPIFSVFMALTGLAEDVSAIWFGVFLVRTMEIGFVHPPIGINPYVIQNIAAAVPLGRIFRGVLPFLAADFLHLALPIAVPSLALALPRWLW